MLKPFKHVPKIISKSRPILFQKKPSMLFFVMIFLLWFTFTILQSNAMQQTKNRLISYYTIEVFLNRVSNLPSCQMALIIDFS